MSARARVSVAMATCNGARFVDAQLASLAAQSRPPDELVVCDDASEDDTLERVRAFAARAPFAVRVEPAAARLGTPVRILLNRVPPRLGGLEEVHDALGPARDRILAPSLGNRVAFSQAMITGRTAPEIATLLAEIDGILAAA